MSLLVTFVLALVVGAIIGLFIVFPVLPEFLAKASWLELRKTRRKVGRGIMFVFTGHHVCEYPGCVTLADHEVQGVKRVSLCCKHYDTFTNATTGGVIPGRAHD
jgi:hypothetical protein